MNPQEMAPIVYFGLHHGAYSKRKIYVIEFFANSGKFDFTDSTTFAHAKKEV